MDKISLRCQSCGGVLEVDKESKMTFCPYCGEKTLVVDSDAVKIAQIQTDAQKELELKKLEQKDEFRQVLVMVAILIIMLIAAGLACVFFFRLVAFLFASIRTS